MAGHPRRTPGPLGAEIARYLRGEIAMRELSQAQVAARADISPSQLSRYLRAISSPTIEEFLAICDAVNIPAATVITNATIQARYGPADGADSQAEHVRERLQQALSILGES